MSKKLNYTAPAVLDDLALELEAEILGASNVEVDENFEKVETMGQEVGATVSADQWQQQWQ